MEQLKMLWLGTPIAKDIIIPEGFEICTHSDSRIDGWISACEELNQGLWKRKQFDESMLGDAAVSPDRIFYIVQKSTDIVGGTATARIPADSQLPSLHMVGVANAFRGMKLSAPICAAVIECFISLGISRASLKTDDFRIPAIKTYLKLGYRPCIFASDMEARWNAIYETLGITRSSFDFCE